MSFKPDIPQATDKPSNSQRDLLNNFTFLDTAVANNHIALTAASSEAGKHAFLQLPERDGTASAPYLSTAVNEVGLLSRNTSTNPDLLFVPENTLAANVPTAALRLTGGGLTLAAYCRFTGAGVLVANGYNVDTVNRTNEGRYTVSFIREFGNLDFIPIIIAEMQAASELGIGIRNISYATASISFETRVIGLNAFIDPQTVYCAFLGLLA